MARRKVKGWRVLMQLEGSYEAGNYEETYWVYVMGYHLMEKEEAKKKAATDPKTNPRLVGATKRHIAVDAGRCTVYVPIPSV